MDVKCYNMYDLSMQLRVTPYLSAPSTDQDYPV